MHVVSCIYLIKISFCGGSVGNFKIYRVRLSANGLIFCCSSMMMLAAAVAQSVLKTRKGRNLWSEVRGLLSITPVNLDYSSSGQRNMLRNISQASLNALRKGCPHYRYVS